MAPRTKLLRVAAIFSSLTLVAVYIGCRANGTAAKPAKTDGTQTEVFSGSKSEVITTPSRTEHFVGSKSAAVFPTTGSAPPPSVPPPPPPPPPVQRASRPK